MLHEYTISWIVGFAFSGKHYFSKISGKFETVRVLKD